MGYKENVAQSLNIIKTINKLTSQEMADKLDMSYLTYYKIVSLKKDVKVNELEKIEKVFNVPVCDLLTGLIEN